MLSLIIIVIMFISDNEGPKRQIYNGNKTKEKKPK